jgi:hypothetical protein
MGQSNLKSALERKLALLKGELGDKQKRVEHIETLFRDELPVLSARTHRVNRLIECAEELLAEIDPTWTPERVKAVRPNVHKAPTAIGRISKGTLVVMREAGKPLTIREIADQLVAMEGVGEIDDKTHKAIRNAIDSSLRQKVAKNIVQHDGAKFARKWSLVARH